VLATHAAGFGLAVLEAMAEGDQSSPPPLVESRSSSGMAKPGYVFVNDAAPTEKDRVARKSGTEARACSLADTEVVLPSNGGAGIFASPWIVVSRSTLPRRPDHSSSTTVSPDIQSHVGWVHSVVDLSSK